MIYPIGQRVSWRADISPRKGAQTGTLTREWQRYGGFPWVRWDDAQGERQELPECVTPIEEQREQAMANSKNAWEEYRAGRARA